MGYNINHPIVRDGLVFAVDAGYDRSYDSRENLANNSTYNATTWTLPNGNATLTAGIDAPDGTNTAVRFTGTNAGNALLRVSHPSVTPNGTDSYTVSFFARYVSGSTASNGIATDWTDAGPSGDYTGSLILNTWVRISFTAVATAVARTFVDIISDTTTNRTIDFWGLQVEKSPTATTYTPTNGSVITRQTTTWTDMSGVGNNGTLVGGAVYNSGNAGTFSFDGVNDCVNCGNAASLDIRRTMTLEAWFKVNNFNFPSGWSNLINKMNAAGDLNTRTYAAWINAARYIHFTTSDSTGQQDFNTTSIIVANQWHHWVGIIDRTNGNVFQYVDGILNTNGSGTVRTNDTVSHSNPMFLNVPTGSFYSHFQGNIAIARVYNRCLTASEVTQNFAAHRGRFGI
jgi:hypothetical protein